MSHSVEKKLFDAVYNGRASEVSSLLRDHPEIDVNWTDEDQWTALHVASYNDHAEVVKVLFAHPNITVNVRNEGGQSPLSIGCERGHESIVKVLLKDPRVDVTLDDEDGCTPLWYASRNGNCEVIECLIASDRDLGDVKNKKGNDWDDGKYLTVLEIARKRNRTEVASLLERFIDNPALTRHEVRVKLGFTDALSAEVFAMTIFLCDDLLHLKPAENPAAAAAIRFFVISFKLPMELQMVLCHRAVGSMKQSILHKDSEAAFRSLARILLVATSPSLNPPSEDLHPVSNQSKQSIVS